MIMMTMKMALVVVIIMINGAVFRTTFSPIVSGVFPYFFLSEKSLNLKAKKFEKSFSMRAPHPPPSQLTW